MPFPCGPSSRSDNTHQLTLWSNVLCTWLPFLTQHIVRGRAWQQTTCVWYSFKLGARRPKLQLILKGGIMQSTVFFIVQHPQVQSQMLKWGWCISRAKRHYSVPCCAAKAIILTFTSHLATPVIDLAIILLRTKVSCCPECAKILENIIKDAYDHIAPLSVINAKPG